uniref:Fatty acid hydroxylase domain-containing protein n=1 Tax=Chlamydomonas leiostraca TaxID=1034604 RepID=A0A7S0RXB2_9CHLO|mmetsp:Transcript_33335/g.84467  ORF Transcript_33335/g.84467 Transcript_33335/m.84467 type:complete len:377 (+) Transcript_33335:85-1215(+)
MEVLREQVSGMMGTIAEKLKPGTDEFWMCLTPPLVYWLVAIYFDILDHSKNPYVIKHRVTRRDRGRENPVGRWAVIQRVILQHVLQTIVGVAVMLADPDHCSALAPKSWLQSGVQFVIAMFIMDAWQYWIHRAVHVNTWLYKHIHSVHHQLLITYAYGALYNNPIEAILLDTCGAGVAMYVSGMTCKMATAFFAFSTIKTVVDHSNYRFPLNPLHDLFPNSAAYHDVHHDIRGIKKNFSQPFFTFWDVLCGTYLDPTDFHLSQAELDAKVDADVSKAAAKAAITSPKASPAPKKAAPSPSPAKQRPTSPAKAGPQSPKMASPKPAAGATTSAVTPKTAPKTARKSAAAVRDVPPPSTGVTTRSRARRVGSGTADQL